MGAADDTDQRERPLCRGLCRAGRAAGQGRRRHRALGRKGRRCLARRGPDLVQRRHPARGHGAEALSRGPFLQPSDAPPRPGPRHAHRRRRKDRRHRPVRDPAGNDPLKTRREHDSLGEVEVPADRLWGAQTQRSIENFPIGRPRFVWGRGVIRALGIVKKAAAEANAALGELPADKAARIVRAAEEVIAGKHDAEFPLVAFQTGSGTQANMNANEVIARLAKVHPNDDVNRSQSSNDAFPAVMHIAAVEAIDGRTIPAVRRLRDTLAGRGEALGGIVIIGRTHLMDATPLTLGQLFSGWVAQLDQAVEMVGASLDLLYELSLGGTAVGNSYRRSREAPTIRSDSFFRAGWRSSTRRWRWWEPLSTFCMNCRSAAPRSAIHTEGRERLPPSDLTAFFGLGGAARPGGGDGGSLSRPSV